MLMKNYNRYIGHWNHLREDSKLSNVYIQENLKNISVSTIRDYYCLKTKM